MKIAVIENDGCNLRPMPTGIFLARRGGPTGSLHIIVPVPGMNKKYRAIDLEGRGPSAVGEISIIVDEDWVRADFIPIFTDILLRNEW